MKSVTCHVECTKMNKMNLQLSALRELTPVNYSASVSIHLSLFPSLLFLTLTEHDTETNKPTEPSF